MSLSITEINEIERQIIEAETWRNEWVDVHRSERFHLSAQVHLTARIARELLDAVTGARWLGEIESLKSELSRLNFQLIDVRNDLRCTERSVLDLERINSDLRLDLKQVKRGIA